MITDTTFYAILEDWDEAKTSKRLTLAGTGAGLLIWATFYTLEIASQLAKYGSYSFIRHHQNSPSCWMVDLLPAACGLVAYFTAKTLIRYASVKRLHSIEKEANNKQLFDFTEQLNNGVLNAPAAFDTSSELAQAVLKLRENLLANQQKEKQRIEAEKQHRWEVDGLAKFGEILRLNNENLETLSYEIISNLVRYLKANQGGFFLLEDSNPYDSHFIQTAAFAYDRRKQTRKRVELNDGLIGASAFEKESIFMTDIPNDYVTITSGLGGGNPKCLLIVPLMVDDQVLGIIEMASFSVLQKHEIVFVESLSAAIASSIRNVKVASNTAKLLEQSKQQSELLKEQEEVMRYTIEELHATQEEASKKSDELGNLMQSVNSTLVRAEYDTAGKLLYANDQFLSKLGYLAISDIQGKHISSFINSKDKEWFFAQWDTLIKGDNHIEGDMKHLTKQGTDFWSMATYTCVRNQNGDIQKILFMGIDITEQKKSSLDLASKVFALNSSAITADLCPNGYVCNGNVRFQSVIGYSTDELKILPVYNLFPSDSAQSFKKVWDDVIKGNPQEGQYLMVSKKGEERWLQGTFTAVYDMYNELSKIVLIANDITTQKKLELETKQKNQQLLLQDSQLKQKIQEIEAVRIRNEKTLEGAMDAIITISSDETVELYNSAAEEMFGYAKAEVVGQNIRVLLPAEYREMITGDIVAYLKSDKNRFKSVRTEVTTTDKWGNELSLLLTISEAHIGEECTYTAFIQNISVELF